jgi:hypothetical protein
MIVIDLPQRPRIDKTHPKPFFVFIMEAIDEVAPGQGDRVYWLAFERYQEAWAREKRDAAAKELRAAIQGKRPPPEEPKEECFRLHSRNILLAAAEMGTAPWRIRWLAAIEHFNTTP